MEKNPIFISLGNSCQPAHQLALNGLRESAFPFDWIATSFDSLYSVLENDFRGFFDKNNIKHEAAVWPAKYPVLNLKFGIVFPHEFESEKDYQNNFEKAEAKYNRRIKRFYRAINSGRPVLFIRQHSITKEQAAKLNELIATKFPGLKYNLLVIDKTDEIRNDWKIPNVLNCYLETTGLEDALSFKYNDVWTGFLSKIFPSGDWNPGKMSEKLKKNLTYFNARKELRGKNLMEFVAAIAKENTEKFAGKTGLLLKKKTPRIYRFIKKFKNDGKSS